MIDIPTRFYKVDDAMHFIYSYKYNTNFGRRFL